MKAKTVRIDSLLRALRREQRDNAYALGLSLAENIVKRLAARQSKKGKRR